MVIQPIYIYIYITYTVDKMMADIDGVFFIIPMLKAQRFILLRFTELSEELLLPLLPDEPPTHVKFGCGVPCRS